MGVVLVDQTNKIWCMEQPDDGLLHVGYVGKAGPRVEDLLEFAASREKQFRTFIEKKERSLKDGHTLRDSKNKRDTGVGVEKSNTGARTESGGPG